MTSNKEYIVEFYKEDLLFGNKKQSRGYNFLVQAQNIEKAAVLAHREIKRRSNMRGHNKAIDAVVIGPNKEKYKILKDGSWLINPRTGERLSDLEDWIKV